MTGWEKGACAWCAAPFHTDSSPHLCHTCEMSLCWPGVGPCARCGAATVRYGDDSHPLCRACQLA